MAPSKLIAGLSLLLASTVNGVRVPGDFDLDIQKHVHIKVSQPSSGGKPTATPTATPAGEPVPVNKLPLCAPEIVEDTCELFGSEAKVTQDNLRKVLAADADSVPALWTQLSLSAEQSISCSDLCQSVTALLGKDAELPPASDLGCRFAAGKQVCDIDLSPKTVATLVPAGSELPDLHDKVKEPVEKGKKSKVKPGLVLRKDAIDYDLDEILRRIANLFRIYPTPAEDFVKSGQEVASLLESNRSTEEDYPKFKGFFDGLFGSKESDWKRDVAERNLQAQAYVNNAIKKLSSLGGRKLTAKWFGDTTLGSTHMMKELNRVLNSVVRMMGEVEYVFPGPQCSPNTYAYVYPRGSKAKDKKGKYVFYLCELYMNSDAGVQIETLTHEGSHHATAYTDDVCMDEFYGGSKPVYVEESVSRFSSTVQVGDQFDWRKSSGRTVTAEVRLIKGDVVVLQLEPDADCENTAYGRSGCAKLAQKDAIKALRNADNICYWIQDVAES